MQVTFKLIRPERSTEETGDVLMHLISTAVWIGGLALLIAIFEQVYIVGIIALILYYTSGHLLLKLHPGFAKKKDVVGWVKFDETGVNILEGNNDIRLDFQMMERMELTFNYVQGYGLNHKDKAHNGLASMVFTEKNGQTHNLKFLMDEMQQYHDFKLIMKSIYQHKVIVKEKLGNGLKTILLEFDHNYAKLQALKKELGVDRFYGN
jgi:hypothetical protein